MAKQSSLQRQLRQEMERHREGPLREVASEAWEEYLAVRREAIAAQLYRRLGREADSFPNPIKGRWAVVELDGLIFGLNSDQQLSIVVECPVCGESGFYGLEQHPGGIYAALGAMLANAEIDPRCSHCVNANRHGEPS